MKRRSIAVLCGGIAMAAVAGWALMSVLASDSPGQAVEAANLGLGSVRWMDAFEGMPLEGPAEEAANLADTLASLNSRIDPDIHVTFSDGAGPVMDGTMTAALPETPGYEYDKSWGEAPVISYLWKQLFNENLATILNAYHDGIITKEEYYGWMNREALDYFWPEALYGQDAFDNYLVRKTGSGLDHGAKKDDTAEDGVSGSTGSGGGIYASNTGGDTGSGRRSSGGTGGNSGSSGSGGSGSGGGASNNGSNGGYDTEPDFGAQETWGDSGPATEEGVADFFSDMGGTMTSEDIAALGINDHGNAVIR